MAELRIKVYPQSMITYTCALSFFQQIAGVAELVDAPDSKSGLSNGVGVRFPSPAPRLKSVLCQYRAL